MNGAADVLSGRDELINAIADAIRLLELPEFRALVDMGQFSFPAGTVVARLMSGFVDMINVNEAISVIDADACRYRFLRDKNGITYSEDGPNVEIFIDGEAFGAGHLDAQIDAALSRIAGVK